jgi:uncharacterized membrane protein
MADSDSPAIFTKKPWLLTFCGVFAASGLIAMPFLAGPPDGAKMPDVVRFLGHFHPVLLHLPIGVFALILFQELGEMFGKRREREINPSLFPLIFGAASAIVAVLAGFLLYHGGEEYGENDLMDRHLWGGLIFAVAAILTLVLKAWTVAIPANPAFYRLLLFGSVGVMGFASHDGASITHGPDYLTVYAPDPVRKALGFKGKSGTESLGREVVPVKSLQEQLIYADIVAPIFERRCVQCHKEGKAKGKLRMDTFEMLVKGGSEGPAFEPGDASESNILLRVALPMDDEEHMPPEGKPQLQDHEIVVLKWWIDSGADATKKLGESDPPAPIREAIAKLEPKSARAVVSTAPHAASEKSAGPDAALQSTVAAFSKDFPGVLSFESQNSSALAFTAGSLRGSLDDSSFNKLGKLLGHLVTVDLSATKITDQSVALLAAANHLRVIRLAETGVTDAAIETLLKLESLESINLYGTKVTDAGVTKLAAMTHLKRLYLWQTAVTPEAVKTLREKLPGCEIVTGT